MFKISLALALSVSAACVSDPAHPRAVGIEQRLAPDRRRAAAAEIFDLDPFSRLDRRRQIAVGDALADGIAESGAGHVADRVAADQDRLLAHHDDRRIVERQAAKAAGYPGGARRQRRVLPDRRRRFRLERETDA